jgi:hypothetical protein
LVASDDPTGSGAASFDTSGSASGDTTPSTSLAPDTKKSSRRRTSQVDKTTSRIAVATVHATTPAAPYSNGSAVVRCLEGIHRRGARTGDDLSLIVGHATARGTRNPKTN